MKYERLTDRKIAEMLRNTEGESWDSDNIEAQCYIRLAELEDKIESGELDYVADSKTEQTITDLLIEFDEMGFAPTTVCPNAEQYAIDWRDRVRKEFARLTEQEKQAVETLTRSFTRMETLYKVKCTEIEAKEEEMSDLKAENAALQKRLENAVELPCIEPMTTWDWDDTTGLGKSNFGKYWKVLYRDEDGEFMAYMGATKAEAEAMLKDLRGGAR